MRRGWRTIAAVICMSIFVCFGACNSLQVQAAMSQQQVQAAIDAAVPGVVCWGDSITQGESGRGGLGYPELLEMLIDQRLIQPIRVKYGYAGLKAPDVVNLGVYTETSLEIAGRDGAIPYLINQDFVIPASTDPVSISFFSAERGATTKPIREAEGGVNSVYIGGIEGELIRYFSVEEDSSKYMFRRLVPGAPVLIHAGEPIITYAARHYGDYLMIIMMGCNGDYTSIEDLELQYQAMINHQTLEKERYIAAELPRCYETDVKKMLREEAAMAAYFGPKHMNVRTYMMQYGLLIAGITPTPLDVARLQAGQIPVSLLQPDLIHFTQTGYLIMADMFYNKMDQLGYFDGLKVLAQ